ncbi:uncharacterized protein YabE (DUF348 family) [Salibacterium salarium]|uniref:G5 and 3D domain-containing protein n=1 Tax=Salibacterium salarium TaxID=284579 RepID=UPI002788B8BC|nr:G5 and 3D domain-containing protein [Salibacterium salarium]MDQ0300946.1 uncharacterized protein YabE (DUF348 family) [Salibacterium salarium]
MVSKWNDLFSGLKPGKSMILVFSVLLLTAAGLFYAVYETTKATVTIEIDEEEKVTVATHAKTVDELLKEQNFNVAEEDELSSSLQEPIVGNMKLEWNKAKQITVSEDGEEQDIWTTAATVEEVMDNQDIKVSNHDYINKELDESIEEGMHVTYESAFPVTVKDEDGAEEVMTTSASVYDLLEDADRELDGNDRVEPGKEKMITDETEIQIIRVEEVTDVVEEEVDYATVTRRDDSLAQGAEEVVEDGEKGKVEKKYNVVLENGEEVSRELIDETEVKESRDQVVAVGPSEQTATVSRGESPGAAGSNGRTISMHATAYTADCTGCSGVTATGVNLNNSPNAKVVAVDPSVIPLGSRVYVEGYGEATAADTGGAINGNRIDLHVSSKAEANRFGRQTVEVTVLE